MGRRRYYHALRSDARERLSVHRQWLRWAVRKNAEYARYFRAVVEEYTGPWGALDASGVKSLTDIIGNIFYRKDIINVNSLWHKATASPVEGAREFYAPFRSFGGHEHHGHAALARPDGGLIVVDVAAMISFGLVHFVFVYEDQHTEKAMTIEDIRRAAEGGLVTLGGVVVWKSVGRGMMSSPVIVPPEYIMPPLARRAVEDTLRRARKAINVVAAEFSEAFRGDGWGPETEGERPPVPAPVLPSVMEVAEWARGAGEDDAAEFIARLRRLEDAIVDALAGG